MTNITSPEDPNMSTAASSAEGTAPAHTLSKGYVRYAMVVLLIIYIFNFLDRQIVNILGADIKAELKIGDKEFGALAGTAFAFLYTFMGIPIARLAERRNRPIIMSTSLAIWSGFTALCGLATGFWQFALARVGVGIGEAGGTPPAHSLITDYTPKEKRASALAFYSMGVPLGTLVGLIFGGLIADLYGWRTAFYVAGLPGLALAVITWLTLKETRPKQGKVALAPHKASILEVFKVLLFSKPTFWLIAFGAAVKSFISYGQASFHPIFFFGNHGPAVAAAAQDFGMGEKTRFFVGLIIGLISGIAGAASSIFGGYLADKLGKKDIRNTMWPPAIAALVSVPIYIAAILSPDMWTAFTLLIVPYLLNYFWYGPVYSTTQGLVQPYMRATAAAILLFVINMLGLGLGPFIVGLISDSIANAQLLEAGTTLEACKQAGKAAAAVCGPATAHGLKMSLVYCSFAGLLSFALFVLARRTIVRDMES
jgi:MFS family permease